MHSSKKLVIKQILLWQYLLETQYVFNTAVNFPDGCTSNTMFNFEFCRCAIGPVYFLKVIGFIFSILRLIWVNLCWQGCLSCWCFNSSRLPDVMWKTICMHSFHLICLLQLIVSIVSFLSLFSNRKCKDCQNMVFISINCSRWDNLPFCCFTCHTL